MAFFGLMNTAIISLLMMMCICGGLSMAAVYEVGDSAGWTSMGGVDYQHWAADKIFKLGDVVVFNYNNQFHNVKQVNLDDFETCNASSPITTYSNGADSIELEKEGDMYLICGVPGHCELGQKLHIFVAPSTTSPAVSPSPASTKSESSSSSLSFSKLQLALMALPFVFL
ncbi:Cupredoxin superfamily protein [Euphorbia peplus]|nr:Cupredoxin superfamily protein [Euphorbia peplus]